jgi:hypothetical protein
MDLQNVKEILLSTNDTIHIDVKINSKELQNGCMVLYCNNKWFPYGIEKHGYWYSNGKYDGQMYSIYYAKLTHDWWIDIYPKNWWHLSNFSYRIKSDGNCIKENSIYSFPQDIEGISDLIINVIKQLYSFNIRHNTDFYNKDIEQLRLYLSDYINEILDIELKKIT